MLDIMNHVHEQSKLDESSAGEDENPVSYYYDDATNYEIYRDDDEDENESPEDTADD
jgi:hypothetical protein